MLFDGIGLSARTLEPLRARGVATLRPEVLLTSPKRPRWRLELQNEQKRKTKVATRR
jgi:hypothetical protein